MTVFLSVWQCSLVYDSVAQCMTVWLNIGRAALQCVGQFIDRAIAWGDFGYSCAWVRRTGVGGRVVSCVGVGGRSGVCMVRSWVGRVKDAWDQQLGGGSEECMGPVGGWEE